MITLTFIQASPLLLTGLPEQWAERITQQIISGKPRRYLIKIEVDVEDTSYRYRAVMRTPELVLKFSLPYFVDFPVGTQCTYQGTTYTLNSPEGLKKHGTRNIEYSLSLGTRQDELKLFKLRNSVDGRLKFPMCARPHEFAEEICRNLNARDGEGVWTSVKEHCLDSTEKTVEFNHVNLEAALTDIANTFETEWEVIELGNDRYEIRFGKVEYFKANPLALSYGKGNGFVPGVGRTTATDGAPIRRLYIQGTDRNINADKYGNDILGFDKPQTTLLLPLGQTIAFDGEHFEDEAGYDSTKATTYVSSSAGDYIERQGGNPQATKEDSIDLTEIYPSREGRVTWVKCQNSKKNWYDFADADNEINFSDYSLPDEKMTVIFQSGMLSGKEFEVKYYHEADGDNPAHRFELVPQEIDGVIMPNDTWRPQAKDEYEGAEGDTYAVFGIQLPMEYICNNTLKKGAAWDMMREAVKYLHEHETQKFTFTGELQGLWTKRNWEQVGGYLLPGGYIHFSDTQFAPQGEDIRISGIKEYVNTPYSPTIELSNATSGSGATAQLRKADRNEVYTDSARTQMMQFARRRFRDATETAQLLADAAIKNFTEGISPITVQTMSAIVGDESLQFVLGSKADDGEFVTEAAAASFSAATSTLTLGFPTQSKQLYLRHMTLGVNADGQRELTALSRAEGYAPMWPMPSAMLTPPDSKARYVYAKVLRNDTTTAGTWEMSTSAIDLYAEADYYYLLLGIITSEVEGTRSFASLYGYTEILPGHITTDRIVSANGQTYFDLAAGEIGGVIKFLNAEGKYMTLIDGGYIRTELIDTDSLIAHRVEVGDPSGKHVIIEPHNEQGEAVGQVRIYQDADTICTMLEGASYSSINQLYGATTSGNVSMIARTAADGELYGYSAPQTLARGKATFSAASPENDDGGRMLKISEPWHSDAANELTFTGGHIQATAHLKAATVRPGELAPAGSSSIRMSVAVYTYESKNSETGELSNLLYMTTIVTKTIALNYATASTTRAAGSIIYNAQSQSSGYIALNGKKAILRSGWHVIVVTYSPMIQGLGNTAKIEWGNTGEAADKTTDIAANWKSDFYVSRFFANGFCLGTRKDDYILAYRDGSNGMRLIFENNGWGLDLSRNGIKIMRGDGIPHDL